MAVKHCGGCDQDLPTSEFHRNRGKPDGLSTQCKDCARRRTRRHAQWMLSRDPEEFPTALEKRCSRCRLVLPADAFNRSRKSKSGLQSECFTCVRDRRYGLEAGEYDRRMKAQDGKCAICRSYCQRGYQLSVDHEHDTGKVRGLLCQNCNAGLGMFGDDPTRLAQAIVYLGEGGGV